MSQYPPLSKLSKDKIRWLEERRCSHGHSLIQHRQCEEEGRYENPKIAFFDIECTNLKADHGLLTTWVVKDAQTGKIYKDTLTKEDIDKWDKLGKEDTRLIKNLVATLLKFDKVIGHFSGLFDLPFIRTRAVICGVEFPHYGSLFQDDTWKYLKKKFQLSRNSLKNGSMVLTGATDKTFLHPQYQRGAIRGEKWALDYILQHNVYDVNDTEKLYYKVMPYMRQNKTSI